MKGGRVEGGGRVQSKSTIRIASGRISFLRFDNFSLLFFFFLFSFFSNLDRRVALPARMIFSENTFAEVDKKICLLARVSK